MATTPPTPNEPKFACVFCNISKVRRLMVRNTLGTDRQTCVTCSDVFKIADRGDNARTAEFQYHRVNGTASQIFDVPAPRGSAMRAAEMEVEQAARADHMRDWSKQASPDQPSAIAKRCPTCHSNATGLIIEGASTNEVGQPRRYAWLCASCGGSFSGSDAENRTGIPDVRKRRRAG
jgi:hypothetical protein